MNKAYEKICIGTANFGQEYGFNKNLQLSKSEVFSILSLARDNNIKTIDTAANYGKSEKLIGDFGNDKWNIITKIPAISNSVDIKSDISNYIQNSLEELRQDKLYGLLIHNINDMYSEKFFKIFEEISKKKSEKLVSKIGVSLYSPDDIKYVKDFDIDLVQIPLNIFDRRFIETGSLKELYRKNIEIHARSIFLQGNLLKNFPNLPNYFLQWKDLWANWHEWLDNRKLTPLKVCLNFAISFKEINKIILGIDSKNHLIEIIENLGDNHHTKYPDISSTDEFLVNPMKWKLN